MTCSHIYVRLVTVTIPALQRGNCARKDCCTPTKINRMLICDFYYTKTGRMTLTTKRSAMIAFQSLA